MATAPFQTTTLLWSQLTLSLSPIRPSSISGKTRKFHLRASSGSSRYKTQRWVKFQTEGERLKSTFVNVAGSDDDECSSVDNLEDKEVIC